MAIAVASLLFVSVAPSVDALPSCNAQFTAFQVNNVFYIVSPGNSADPRGMSIWVETNDVRGLQRSPCTIPDGEGGTIEVDRDQPVASGHQLMAALNSLPF